MNTKNSLAGAIALLHQHNEWRRGAEIPQHNPNEIGEAIDLVLSAASERDDLRAWKDSALAVESEWDEQATAKLLGVPLGMSCRKGIGEKVPLLIQERDRLSAEVGALHEHKAQQLAACDAAAMMDTAETHEKNKTVTRDNPFWSPAFESVMRRTAECIALRAEVERSTRSEKEARQAETDVRQMLDTYVGVEQRAEKAEADIAFVRSEVAHQAAARRKADGALRAIKLSCLTATDGPKALAHIVRLCIDAGVTDHLDELTAPSCPHDTDGDGDCHVCAGRGPCPRVLHGTAKDETR